jgi:hypothetical protein
MIKLFYILKIKMDLTPEEAKSVFNQYISIKEHILVDVDENNPDARVIGEELNTFLRNFGGTVSKDATIDPIEYIKYHTTHLLDVFVWMMYMNHVSVHTDEFYTLAYDYLSEDDEKELWYIGDYKFSSLRFQQTNVLDSRDPDIEYFNNEYKQMCVTSNKKVGLFVRAFDTNIVVTPTPSLKTKMRGYGKAKETIIEKDDFSSRSFTLPVEIMSPTLIGDHITLTGSELTPHKLARALNRKDDPYFTTRDIFSNRFKESTYDILNEFDWSGCVLSGGFVFELSKWRMNLHMLGIADTDLFLYGTDEQILSKALYIFDYLKTHSIIVSAYTQPNQNLINILVKPFDDMYTKGGVVDTHLKIQLIGCSGCRNGYNIFNNFDFDLNVIFFDGIDVYCSYDALKAYQTGVTKSMKPNLKRNRMAKCLMRGFYIDIVHHPAVYAGKHSIDKFQRNRYISYGKSMFKDMYKITTNVRISQDSVGSGLISRSIEATKAPRDIYGEKDERVFTNDMYRDEILANFQSGYHLFYADSEEVDEGDMGSSDKEPAEHTTEEDGGDTEDGKSVEPDFDKMDKSKGWGRSSFVIPLDVYLPMNRNKKEAWLKSIVTEQIQSMLDDPSQIEKYLRYGWGSPTIETLKRLIRSGSLDIQASVISVIHGDPLFRYQWSSNGNRIVVKQIVTPYGFDLEGDLYNASLVTNTVPRDEEEFYEEGTISNLNEYKRITGTYLFQKYKTGKYGEYNDNLAFISDGNPFIVKQMVYDTIIEEVYEYITDNVNPFVMPINMGDIVNYVLNGRLESGEQRRDIEFHEYARDFVNAIETHDTKEELKTRFREICDSIIERVYPESRNIDPPVLTGELVHTDTLNFKRILWEEIRKNDMMYTLNGDINIKHDFGWGKGRINEYKRVI